VIQAIQTQNNVNPAGQIGGEPIPQGQQFTYTVRTQGRLVTPEEFGKIIIRANPTVPSCTSATLRASSWASRPTPSLPATTRPRRRHGHLPASRLERRRDGQAVNQRA
jgi:hypothetical protein